MPETVGAILIASLAADTTVASFTAAGWAVSVTAPATTLFGFGAATVGSAALIGGSLAAGALLSQPSVAAPSVPRTFEGTQTLKQAYPPRICGYGRARIAGAYMLYDTDDATHKVSYDVLAMHHGKVAGWPFFYLNDDLVVLEKTAYGADPDPSGGGGYVNFVAADQPTTAGRNDGRYGGAGRFVLIQTRLGAVPETPFSTPITSEIASPKWTSNHRGDGIASMMLQCAAPSGAAGSWSSNANLLYPRGLPKLSAVGDLLAVYDPRDSSQSQGTPSTWKHSHNPVLQILDYLTNTDHGLGQSWTDLIAPNLVALKAQADICDELVTRNDGTTEPRYRASGWWYLSTDPAEVLAAILASCDGWMTEGPNGSIVIIVGKYSTPSVTITDDHILAHTIDFGVPDEEVINEIRISYTPPANDYREAAGIPWRDTADISARGRVRSQSVSFAWVHSHTQARRLAKRAMARNLAPLRGTMVTTLYGLQMLGQRWIKVQSSIIADLSDAVIEVSRLRFDLLRAQVSFEWAVVNPNAIDAWDETTEEGTEPSFLYPTDVTAAPTGLALTDAGSQVIQVQITAIAKNPSLRFKVGTKLGAAAEMFHYFTEPLSTHYTTTMLANVGAAGTYDVRIAVVNPDGTVGTFSGTSSIAIS